MAHPEIRLPSLMLDSSRYHLQRIIASHRAKGDLLLSGDTFLDKRETVKSPECGNG